MFTFCLQDKFERVNKAYEFLCSRSAHAVDGPDPRNILLVIKTQSILFSRYKDGKKWLRDADFYNEMKILLLYDMCM